MNRLAHRRLDDATLQKLAADRDLIIQALGNNLPPSVVGMFPKPSRLDENMAVWESTRGGKPEPFNRLDAAAAQAARDKLLSRFASIQATLTKQVESGQISPADVTNIEEMLASIPEEAIVIVGTEPFVLFWNSAFVSDKPTGPLLAPPIAIAASTVAQVRKPWFWWVVLAILVSLLLLALACWLWSLKTADKTGLQHVPSADSFAAVEAARIEDAVTLCPEQRPAELAPEIVIVFDHSGSSSINITATPEEEFKFFSNIEDLVKEPDFSFLSYIRMKQRLDSEPRRISIAKQAATDLVQKAAPDVPVGLVQAGDCPAAANLGMFRPDRRAELKAAIGLLEPVGGTPLADALRQAGNMVDGKSRKSMILVITDGQDTCDGDPCSVAKQLAATKPHLQINVIDIGNSQSGDCLARAGRGNVYSAKSLDELNLSFDRATQTVQVPDHCTK
jgi:hypothetical protein